MIKRSIAFWLLIASVGRGHYSGRCRPAAWVCTTSFFEERQQVIDSDPPSGADKRLDERVDILLGIAKYTNDEITHFTGYPENALIVLLAQSPEAPPKLTPFEPAPPSHISK